jgi:hypothetical protein
MMRWVLLAAAALLAACDDPPREARREAPATPTAEPALHAEARRAAEERVRARFRPEATLTQRAVVVHRQQAANLLAVCGQVSAGRDEPFLPYVALLAIEREQVARTELHLAATSIEATRVFYEMVERCWDGGGPATGRAPSRPMPPAPAGLPRAAPEDSAPRAAAAPAPAPATRPASGSITTRGPANVRATPGGGGEVVRVAPRGTTLNVFGEASGGWLQVGESEPWGWLHNSMVDR